MVHIFRFIFLFTIFLLLFHPLVEAVRRDKMEPIGDSIPRALASGSSVKPTFLSEPLSLNVAGATINAPEGESVGVKNGVASVSYADFVKTKDGGLISSASDLKVSKKGDVSASSVDSYQTRFMKIEGVSGLKISADNSKVSFMSARKMAAGGFTFPEVGPSTIVSKPKGPVQTMDVTLSQKNVPLVQKNPLPVVFDDPTIGISPGRNLIPTHFDVSKLNGINPGSSLGITQKGGEVVIGKFLHITPHDLSKPMQIQSTLFEGLKFQADITNAYLRHKDLSPVGRGSAIHEFEGRNKVSVTFWPGKIVQGYSMVS